MRRSDGHDQALWWTGHGVQGTVVRDFHFCISDVQPMIESTTVGRAALLWCSYFRVVPTGGLFAARVTTCSRVHWCKMPLTRGSPEARVCVLQSGLSLYYTSPIYIGKRLPPRPLSQRIRELRGPDSKVISSAERALSARLLAAPVMRQHRRQSSSHRLYKLGSVRHASRRNGRRTNRRDWRVLCGRRQRLL